ncbi:unnamed protein product [Rhizopus stolonifer]
MFALLSDPLGSSLTTHSSTVAPSSSSALSVPEPFVQGLAVPVPLALGSSGSKTSDSYHSPYSISMFSTVTGSSATEIQDILRAADFLNLPFHEVSNDGV